MAQYRALTDLFLPAPDCRYVQAGDTFVAPVGWIPPTNAVDPIGTDAFNAYLAAGPAGCADAEWHRAVFTNGQRWSGVQVSPAATGWVPVDPTKPDKGFLFNGQVKPPM
jgi:hypothetical protein